MTVASSARISSRPVDVTIAPEEHAAKPVRLCGLRQVYGEAEIRHRRRQAAVRAGHGHRQGST
jgi:hypothetical protein